jgi:uncharacterized membrane-anchored protein YitT (DUF2179 family)
MRTINQKISDYLYIIIGSILAGFGIAAFTTPGKIAGGGVNGIAIILYHTLGLEPGLSMLVMNIPIFIVGLRVFGPKYGFKSLLGMLLLSASVSATGKLIGYGGIIAYTDSVDILLSALFGGIFIGAGIGLVLRSGANTGGTDIISQVLNRYTAIPLGTCLLLVDGLVIITSAFFFGIERAMFAIITVYSSSQMVNYVIMVVGTRYAKTVYLFSEHLETINEMIINELHHGGTIFSGMGIYTKQERKMLMAVIPNQQISRLTTMVHKTDPKAFMIVEEAYQVLGEGFTPMAKIVARVEEPAPAVVPRVKTRSAAQVTPVSRHRSHKKH